MMQRLTSPISPHLRIAYASALGELGVRKAVDPIIALHAGLPSAGWISELNLALARLVGNERFFVQLWRTMRGDPATAAATALHKVRRRLRRLSPRGPAGELAERCLPALGRDELSQGAVLLAEVLQAVATEVSDACTAAVIRHCQACLRHGGPGQLEAIPLAIHCLHALR